MDVSEGLLEENCGSGEGCPWAPDHQSIKGNGTQGPVEAWGLHKGPLISYLQSFTIRMNRVHPIYYPQRILELKARVKILLCTWHG